MVEDRGKDEFSAQNLMKKHEALEAAVEDYRDNVRQLGETTRQLASEGHPQSESIGVRLSQVEKLYAGLKELANERRAKLDDALKLFMLNREVSFRFRFFVKANLRIISKQQFNEIFLFFFRLTILSNGSPSEKLSLDHTNLDKTMITWHSYGRGSESLPRTLKWLAAKGSMESMRSPIALSVLDTQVRSLARNRE